MPGLDIPTIRIDEQYHRQIEEDYSYSFANSSSQGCYCKAIDSIESLGTPIDDKHLEARDVFSDIWNGIKEFFDTKPDDADNISDLASSQDTIIQKPETPTAGAKSVYSPVSIPQADSDIETFTLWLFYLHKQGIVDLGQLNKEMITATTDKKRERFEKKIEDLKKLHKASKNSGYIGTFQKIVTAAGLAIAATASGVATGGASIPVIVALSIATLLTLDDITGDHAKEGISTLISNIIGGDDTTQESIEHYLELICSLAIAGMSLYAGHSKNIGQTVSTISSLSQGGSGAAKGVLDHQKHSMQKEVMMDETAISILMDNFRELLTSQKEVGDLLREVYKDKAQIAKKQQEIIKELVRV